MEDRDNSTTTNGTIRSLRRKGKSGRARTTSSLLFDPRDTPDSPVLKTVVEFQNHIYLPDPDPIYAVLGAAAGNMMRGDPVWLMLVGSSGSGKTAMLKSIATLDHVRTVSSIKGEAAMLSAVKAKDRAKDATGGLLRELGDNGMLVFMDFTGVLSKSQAAVTELLGILRELYDGTWSRDTGSEGGRRLFHTGRVSLLAGVTHAIDRHHEVSAEMGQRCLYYRFPITDGYQETMAAVQDTNPEAKTLAMQRAVNELYECIGLSFADPTPRRELTLTESSRVTGIAQVGAKARSPVPRDWTKREVVDVADPEVSTRMGKQLTQLYLGMEVIGVRESDRWRVVNKVALDSMPLLRRLTLNLALSRPVGVGVSRAEVAREVRVSEPAAGRAIEDLFMVGVFEHGKGQGEWVVGEKVREQISDSFAAGVETERESGYAESD